MNCSYRIIDNVHIGVSVRKTADKSTVPFINKPMKDVIIKSYDNRGFMISHPSMPKEAFLDFDQLPLTEVTIEKGVIKTELTFVEKLINSKVNGLELIRTDTFDYLEMLGDRKEKDNREKFKVSDIKPGDKVQSCMCKESNPMYYIGTYSVVTAKQKYIYGGYYNRQPSHYIDNINKVTRREIFAYKQPNGKFKLATYPLTHKLVIELYKLENDTDSNSFINENINLANIESLLDYNFISKYKNRQDSGEYYANKKNDVEIPNGFMRDDSYSSELSYSTIYISKVNTNVQDVTSKAINYAKERFNVDLLTK